VTDFLHSGPDPFSKASLWPILNSSINEESSLASNAILLSAHDRSIKAPKSVPAPPFSRISLTYVLPYVARHSARQKTRTTLSRFFCLFIGSIAPLFFTAERRLRRRSGRIPLAFSDKHGFIGVRAESYRRPPGSTSSPELRTLFCAPPPVGGCSDVPSLFADR